MMKYLIQTVGVYLTVFSGDIKKKKKKKALKKKALKKSSENDQSTGHFQSFFFFFFRLLDPKSEKNPVNQLIKNSGLSTNLL